MKGKFTPLNPKKYKGDPTNIVWRSSWEFKLMKRLDTDPNIIEWSSEEIVINYRSPMDQKIHRYFVDFYVKSRSPTGKIEETLIEVKPKHQTTAPNKQNINEMKKPKARRYVKEVVTWKVNEAKWNAATKYCADRNWNFKIFTEHELGIK